MNKENKLKQSNEYFDIGFSRTVDALCSEALKPNNIEKNRYTNVLAPNESLVKLGGSDYINANYIDIGSHQKIIACQGPTVSTEYDFWTMALEQKSPVVLMLTRFVEKGKEKCSRYFPEKGKKNYHCGFNVERSNIVKRENYDVSTITISKGGDTHTLKHIYYKTWPDGSVPDKDSLMDCLLEVLGGAESESEVNTPLICHCSAGIGRTGVVATILRCLNTKEDTKTALSIIREQRHGLVQTKEQYRFILDFLC